jgi:hypothetical protein
LQPRQTHHVALARRLDFDQIPGQRARYPGDDDRFFKRPRLFGSGIPRFADVLHDRRRQIAQVFLPVRPPCGQIAAN